MFASVSSYSIRKSCFERKLLRSWLVFLRDWRLQRVNLKRPLKIATLLRGKTMLKGFTVFRSATLRASLTLPPAILSACGMGLMAQAPAAAPRPAARQLGTVTAVAGTSLTLKPDAGQ